MANSIALATKYLPLLDEVYKRESVTSVLDATNTVRFLNANTIEIFKMSMQGLGNYSRNNGFVAGDVTGTWEPHALTKDRGRSFQIDAMDDEETIGLAYGRLAAEFMRTQVIPEMEAYRFATLAGVSGISTATAADITPGTTDVPGLIDTAEAVMGDDEVPFEGRILFISENAYQGLKEKIDRMVTNEDRAINRLVGYYDGMRVIVVPKNRFNTAITLYDGSTSGQEAGGYIVPASTSYPINFMIVHPSAVAAVVKHAVPRVFAPSVNQGADAWKFDYRVYHDIFAYDNKVKGIYLHAAATANS